MIANTKKWVRISLLVLSYVLAISTGAAAGYLFAVQFAVQDAIKTITFLSNARLFSWYSGYAEAQHAYAGDAEYKEALLSFLKLLNEYKDSNDILYTPKAHLMDKTLTYERLSRIEQKLGNQEKSAEYMKLAISTCPGTGWKDCSIEKIQMISKRLEESGMFRPVASQSTGQ